MQVQLSSFAMTVVTYTLLLVAGLWCWFRLSHAKLLRAASNLPKTLPTLPIVGHAHYTMLGLSSVTEYAIGMSMRAVNEGLHTICFWCGPLPVIMVHHVDDVKTVLSTSKMLEKGDEMSYMKYALGTGLLIAPGHIWKKTRRHLNPLFHARNLEQLVPVFNKNSKELVERLSEHVGRGSVDLMEGGMDTALQSVCHLIFGPDVEFDVRSERFRGLLKVVESIPYYFILRILRIWLRFDCVFQFLYRKELAELNILWKRFTETPLKVVVEKMEKKKLNSDIMDDRFNSYSSANEAGPLNVVDVFSVLKKNHPEFTDQELKNEMINFYLTGTDTVSVAYATCLLALAQYQDIQEKLYQEILSVAGTDEDISADDLQGMPYLDKVTKETLRRFTVVPYILRKTADDVELRSCIIPAGNTVVVSLFGPHMDPNLYPDPLKFDPERFASESTMEKDRFAFIPFSGGPRNCVAKPYALLLMKIMVVHVIRRYKLTTKMDVQKLRRKLVVTLVSADGYNVTLESRS